MLQRYFQFVKEFWEKNITALLPYISFYEAYTFKYEMNLFIVRKSYEKSAISHDRNV